MKMNSNILYHKVGHLPAAEILSVHAKHMHRWLCSVEKKDEKTMNLFYGISVLGLLVFPQVEQKMSAMMWMQEH